MECSLSIHKKSNSKALYLKQKLQRGDIRDNFILIFKFVIKGKQVLLILKYMVHLLLLFFFLQILNKRILQI